MREPPHNFEAEQAVLGAVLADNAAYHQVADLLEPAAFADPAHGKLWTAIGRLIERGQPAGESCAAVCQSWGPRSIRRLSGEAATGGDAGAGAADQPRSSSHRDRRQKRRPEVRDISRGFAGSAIGFASLRLARSEGCADRASSDAGLDTQFDRRGCKLRSHNDCRAATRAAGGDHCIRRRDCTPAGGRGNCHNRPFTIKRR